jgi:hypothetical protein
MSRTNKMLVSAWELDPTCIAGHLKALADEILIQPQARYLKLEDRHQVCHTLTVWPHGTGGERYLR